MIGRRLIAGTAVVAAVAAGGVAGALIGIPGISGASTSSNSSTSTTTKSSDAQSNESTHERGHRGHFGGMFAGADKDVLAAGAKALNLSTDALLAKLADGKTTIADVAKDQGVALQAVIDAMAAVAKSDITDLVNNPLPAPPNFAGGPMGGGSGFGFGHFGGGLRENKIDPAAKALGITTDELMQDLRAGKSIADVAKAKNIAVNTVIDAIVNDAQSKIDAAVKAKDLTQDQADKITKDLKTRITDLVNNTRPKGDGHFGPGGPGFGPDGGPGMGFGRGDQNTQAG